MPSRAPLRRRGSILFSLLLLLFVVGVVPLAMFANVLRVVVTVKLVSRIGPAAPTPASRTCVPSAR